MKPKTRQFDMTFQEEPFSLVPESTLDGDALAQASKQRKLDREASEAKQTTLPDCEIITTTNDGRFQVVRFQNGRYGVKDTSIKGMQTVSAGMELAEAKAEMQRRHDPEAALRAMYDRMGVSKEKQDEIIRDATAKAQPGSMVGPFPI